MRVRDWQAVVQQVAESDADPEGWRAVGGDRADGLGEDTFVAHPAVGVLQLKTYAKNPFEVRGVGARVARTVDGDVRDALPDREDPAGRFAVQSPPEDEAHAETIGRRLTEVLRAHSEAPTDPDHLFEDVMEAVEAPAYGPMAYDAHDRPEALDDLTDTFADAEQALDAEFEDLVGEDDVGRGFH
jgi:hypothetical protein